MQFQILEIEMEWNSFLNITTTNPWEWFAELSKVRTLQYMNEQTSHDISDFDAQSVLTESDFQSERFSSFFSKTFLLTKKQK